MDNIGARIKAVRQQRHMSQRALAKRICKCPSAVSGYENNAQTPPLDVCIAIAQVLNISLDELAGLNKGNQYSTVGLSDVQKNIIEMIMAEFHSPTSVNGRISAEQLLIVQELINLFVKD